MGGKFDHVAFGGLFAAPADRHPVWPSRHNFDAFIAGQPQDEIRQDQRRLKKMFNQAAKKSPSFRRLMTWARAHDVKYFIDRKCKVLGYYSPGSGAIGIAAGELEKSLAHQSSVIAHETRHAWQDANGISPHGITFDEKFRALALVEADATAYQSVVMEEIIRGKFEKISKKETKEIMWGAFKGWYASPLAQKYGQALASRRAWSLSIEKAPVINHAYMFQTNNPRAETFDICNRDAVLRTGGLPGRGSYFPKDAQNFLTTVEDRKNALKFYDANRKTPQKLVRDICRAEKRFRVGV